MKMSLPSALAALALLILASAGIPRAEAQAEAGEVLKAVIFQLQNGKPDPQWYGQELWATIALQTNNTGIYPQLRRLGPVQSVQVTEQMPLLLGVMYAITATHRDGQSTWQLGISGITRRIEYARFEVNQAVKPLRPSEPDQPSDFEKSAACKKFPNLC